MNRNDSCLFDNANNDYKHDTDAVLIRKITKLASHINAAAYQFIKMLAEFDRRKGWCQKGMRSCSQWLNWKCGLSYTTAREKLQVAHCLEKLQHINEAFESG